MAEYAIHDVVNDLEQAIGSAQVKFDKMSRLLYSTDASNYQIIPIGVTLPRNADDVLAIHDIANKYGLPLLPRGAGSSLAGQTVNEAIVMDFSRHLRRVRSVNAEEKTVLVEAGMVLGQLNQQLRGLDLMFGPDPASADRATIGGIVVERHLSHRIRGGIVDHCAEQEPLVALDENVAASIGQRLMGHDPCAHSDGTGCRYAISLWTHDAEYAIHGEHVAQEGAIALLEDVQ